MHRFLVGYNVESSRWSRPGVAVRFLQAAVKIHRELALPCTFFLRGQTMEEHPDEFLRARDELGELGDFQQYTYSALPLKTVCQESYRGVSVFHGGTLRQCRDDIARASDVMERVLGSRPTGLGGPLGYYRGLSDRADLLEAVSGLGIRFTRTWTRNARDWFPLPFETQPFRYSAQGFPGVLEIPGQGWPDWVLKESVGHANTDAYIRHMCKDLDYVAARKLMWSCVQHDWCAVETDPEMRAMRAILEHAQKLEFRVQTHRAYSQELAGQT